jgi:hypothetical protein
MAPTCINANNEMIVTIIFNKPTKVGASCFSYQLSHCPLAMQSNVQLSFSIAILKAPYNSNSCFQLLY